MELDYFISGSRIESSFVKDKWLESTAVGTRSFTAAKQYQITGFSGNDNFSVFFTLDKANSNTGILLSNYHGNNRGFSIGFNSNNELFVKSFNDPYFAENITDLRLGTKNCLGIVRNNRNLTFYKYNLHGSGISQYQTVIFPRETNLSGGSFYIGSGSSNQQALGLLGISGTFDQLVCFNAALTQEQSNSIFSGFQPYSILQSSTYSKVYEISGIERRYGSSITEQEIRDLSPFFNSISDQIPTGIGNYVASYSGQAIFGSSFGTWSGIYAFGQSLACYSTGTLVGPVFGTGTWNSTTSTTFSYLDSIYASMNASGERLVSHLVSYRKLITGSLYGDEDYFTYNLYQKYSSGISYAPTLSGAYKNNFVMNGIVTNHNSGITLLANVSGEKYHSLTLEGVFDRTLGLFEVSDLVSSGRVYWGESGRITGYSIGSGYINMLGFSEDNSYPLFYDLGTENVSFIHTTLYNYATGNFDPDTSITFTGLNSWSQLYRTAKRDYWETCTYHLAHAKQRIFPFDYSGIYENFNDHWQ